MQVIKKIAFLLVASIWIQVLSLCSDNKSDKKYDISQKTHEHNIHEFVAEAIAQDRKCHEIQGSVLNHLKEHHLNHADTNIDAAIIIGSMLKSDVEIIEGFTALRINLKDFFVEQLIPEAFDNQLILRRSEGLVALKIQAKERINQKISTVETREHLQSVLAQAILEDLTLDEIKDSTVCYMKNYRPKDYKNFSTIIEAGSRLKLHTKITEGFEVLGLNLNKFLEDNLIEDFFDDKYKLFMNDDFDNLIKLAESAISEKLHSQETEDHVYRVLTRAIMEDFDIATINDLTLNYIQEHHENSDIYKKFSTIVAIIASFKSDDMIMGSFDALDMNFKNYVKVKLIPNLLYSFDSKLSMKDAQQSKIVQFKEGIVRELLIIDMKFDVYNFLSDIIERDSDIELAEHLTLNYVQKYQHHCVLKNVLHQYLLYRPTGAEGEKSIVEKILAMPVTALKFKLITSLLIDSGFVFTEPLLHLVQDSETLQFLTDHGAIDTK